MLTVSSLCGCVLLFTLLLVPGWILGRIGRIREESMLTLGNLLTDIAMPALVLGKLLEVDPAALRWECLLLSFFLPFAVIPFGYFLMRLLPAERSSPERKTVSCFCAAFPNCGFLGIPMAAALFPDAPEAAIYISLFSVSDTFLYLIWGDVVFADREKKRSFLRVFVTPVTAALLLGGVILLGGWSAYFAPAASYVSYFASLTTPLSMLVLGYELSKMSLKRIFTTGTLYTVSAVKMIAAPLFTFAFLLLLSRGFGFAVDTELAVAMLLATGVSTAASSPAVVKKYGSDAAHATVLTLGTTLLCMLTLPLVFLLFRLAF